MRLLVLLIPLLFVLLQHVGVPRWTPAVLTVMFVVLQVPMYQPFGMNFAWGSLIRNPPAEIDRFVDSPDLTPGLTYRVLSAGDGKYGLYATVRAGATIDAEFFPEALHRGGFATTENYARFLRQRKVERVVVFPNYTKYYTRSNEPSILDDMVTSRCVDGVHVAPMADRSDWKLYSVTTGC